MLAASKCRVSKDFVRLATHLCVATSLVHFLSGFEDPFGCQTEKVVTRVKFDSR